MKIKKLLITLIFLLATIAPEAFSETTGNDSSPTNIAIMDFLTEYLKNLETKNWDALAQQIPDDFYYRGLKKIYTLKKLRLIFSEVTGTILSHKESIHENADGTYVLKFMMDVNGNSIPDSLFFRITTRGVQLAGNRCRAFGDIFFSKILNRLQRFGVYLPPGYDSQKKYPVIINLLGASEAFSGWIRPEITQICDKEIRSWRVNEFIGISPQGKRGGMWMNWNDTIHLTEDIILKELLPHIDAIYPTYATANKRAIQGISNGGYGAFSYAIRHPELFCAAISYSGPLAAAHPLCPELSPIYLAQSLYPFPAVDLFFTAGDQDELGMDRQADLFQSVLVKRHIPATRMQFKGGHYHQEWLQHLPLGLKFISQSFR
ncbi:hypothetical protein JXJ21_23795 [candidate division KSB1 bacterium]|nr:hypothetical protein [candidate division KSB1 bacterium]